MAEQPSGLSVQDWRESQHVLSKVDQKGDRERGASVMTGPMTWRLRLGPWVEGGEPQPTAAASLVARLRGRRLRPSRVATKSLIPWNWRYTEAKRT